MMKYVTFFYFMSLSYILVGQSITSSDLDLINGNWSGMLTYTNYSDDQSQVSLKTELVAKCKNGKCKLKFDYTEPNGKVVSGKSKLSISETPNMFTFNGLLSVKSFDIQDQDSWELLLESQGSDNNRPSTIRQNLKIDKNFFTVTKMVRYDGTDKFFQRNQYVFSR